MIFYACIKSDPNNVNSYKGIEVSTLGNSTDVVARFESYDPLEDFRNFVSWSEGVGDDNVGFCDSLKSFAKQYEVISENDSHQMLSMVYGEHFEC
ncbi:hypothetical protein JOC75_000162 [Metabacillus crassostreae]|uniref:hypothetical protein n=1 Tax=Metabacillus crassostreae TaxID=929098 RepID=UPI001959F1C1|nr:hypothetical protein [Metabacillus crassostreae]MBM7602192.1 hypothetical protein [Metabacillus crassostreae]